MFGYQLIALLPFIYAVNCAVNVSIIFALTTKEIKKTQEKKQKKKEERILKMIESTGINGKWKCIIPLSSKPFMSHLFEILLRVVTRYKSLKY